MTNIESQTSLNARLRSLIPSLQEDPTEDVITTILLRCCQQWGITTESELLLLLVSDAAFVRRRLLTVLSQEHRQQAFWRPADVQRLIEKVLLVISRHHISQKLLSTSVKVERGNDIALASKSVADMLLPVPDSEGSISTSSLHSNPCFFTTGCPSLDLLLAGVSGGSGKNDCEKDSNNNNAFEGGFRAGLLTEVYGEAGSGKTQLVLQSLFHCVARQQCEQCYLNRIQKNSTDESTSGVAALYIVSEDFPASRLNSLAAGALEREKERAIRTVSHLPSSTVAHFKLYLDETINVRSVMAGMHIRRIAGLKDLLQMLRDGTLSNAFHMLGNRGLVVVDSIAGAAVTTTGEGVDMSVVSSSAAEVLAVGSLLKAFAVQYGAAVVVTNQVRAQLSSSSSTNNTTTISTTTTTTTTTAAFSTAYSSSAAVVPALGLSWSLAPHVRVQLRRSATSAAAPVGTHASSAVMTAERRLTVLSGPANPPVYGVYTITTDGIRCDS
ncbi:DNA repair protein [Trypanosoma theileri]|uniref:DNA repair protein n=1 Tax=Trypanosoma theileri TaxID=67003 RepID=A0A1X0P0R9_9TRYP|nr:DNA repair protein [Trypanosoma theileri]ORC90099.1 DNA repair protein [Trypanosoma theileri]